MIKKIKILIMSFLLSLNLNALSSKNKKSIELKQEKIEISSLKLVDYPSDKGDKALLIWNRDKNFEEASFEVFISKDNNEWIKAGEFKSSELTPDKISLPFWMWRLKANINVVKIDIIKVFGFGEEEFFKEYKDEIKLYSKLVIKDKNRILESNVVEGIAKGNWFRTDRINNLLILLIISVVFFVIVSHAKRKDLFIRRIPGLDAIDEAVGRATEMGKPVVYVPGIGSMSGVETIASIFILSEVSKKIAQYDTTIKIPHFDPIVFTVAKETVKQAYTEAGRPDSYREDCNMFITQDQFAYAAAVDGMITREKPAACFFLGHFMAESLLLAEVGSSVGAIQIAGTATDHQLPFFITACDYTLIGEELYAAGAYLSREPMLVSVLKVQDFGKLLFIILASVLSIALIIASKTEAHTLIKTIIDILRVN